MKDIVEDQRKEHEHYPMTWMNFNAQQYTQSGQATHNNKLWNWPISYLKLAYFYVF